MNSELKALLEKRGFVGSVLGGAARLAAKPFTAAIKGVGKGAMGLGASAAGVLERSAIKSPGATAFNAVLGVPTVASMGLPTSDPGYRANVHRGRQLAASTTERPMNVHLASSVLSTEDMEAALHVYQQFSKEAARVSLNVPRRGLATLAEELRKAKLFPHQLSEVSGKAQNMARQLTKVEAREAEQAKRLTELHPRNQAKLENEIRLQGLQEEKLKGEAAKLRRTSELEEQEAGRRKTKHEHEMHRWTPGALAKASLIIGGVATGVGAAVQLGATALGKGMDKIRETGKDSRYAAVLKVDPTLKGDPLAQKYFEVLDRASPYLAGEPFLAAAAVQQMINTPSLREGAVPAIQPRQIQDFLNTEAARREVRHSFVPKTRPDLREVANLPLAGG